MLGALPEGEIVIFKTISPLFDSYTGNGAKWGRHF